MAAGSSFLSFNFGAHCCISYFTATYLQLFLIPCAMDLKGRHHHEQRQSPKRPAASRSEEREGGELVKGDSR
jgi:hypothetical protein